MRCLSAVVVVALLALLEGGGVGADIGFWKKYGANKIMKKCLTPFGEKTWVSQLKKALAHCNEQEALGTLPDAALPVNVDLNKATDGPVRFTAAKIENLKQKLDKRVQVFRCVLQKVQVTDSTFEVNPELVLAQYRALNLTDTLYGDIEQAVKQCHQFTQCMPVEARSSMAVPADVIRTKAFLECEKNLRYLGCLKEDLKPLVGSFDLSGLDGTLDFLPSDEARAAAVVLANDKVGYKDYALFE